MQTVTYCRSDHAFQGQVQSGNQPDPGQEGETALSFNSSEARRPRRRLGWRLLTAISGIAVIGSLLFANVAVLAAPGPAVDLDQCRNGGLVENGTQTFIPCTGNGSGSSGWVNGNAGASNAHYAEGESISYRARITGLKNNDQVVLIMGYDVVHGGTHAIDFLTGVDRWQSPETTAALTPDLPCSTVTGCTDPADQQLAPIPEPITNVQVDTSKTLANGCQVAGSGATQQPKTSFNAVPAAQRNMEFFDATPAASNAIQYVGTAPSLLDHNGDQEQQISVTFTANAANPVLAWGGHIARAADWGCADGPNSASGISGSPYHMRIKNVTVNGKAISLGNQDRSLSAAAVIVLQPSLSTTPSAAGPIGTVLNDTATLTAGINPTGTVTFNLWGPDDAGCDGTAVYTQIVAVSGGSATTSPGYTTTAAGLYAWTADYSGDNNNLPASSGCTAEEVTIPKNTPGGATVQNLVPNDRLNLTGATANAGGSVDFYLFAPGVDCGVGNIANAAFTQLDVALVGNDHASTSNTGSGTGMYLATAEGTYHWLAVYSGDANNNVFTSDCVETFAIDN